jgi:hypothetical protein
MAGPEYGVPAEPGDARRERMMRALLSGRPLFGLVLVTLGTLWTLDNLGLLEAEPLLDWWPVLLVLLGLTRIAGLGGRRSPVGGTILTLLGVLLLAATTDVVDLSFADLWPLVLIGIGASILWRAFGGAGVSVGGTNEGDTRDSWVRSFAMMAGTQWRITSPAFKGGEPTAFMGGITYDLRGATPAGDTVTLEVFAMWGGIEIIVPPDWRVVTEVTPIMGGVEDNTSPPTEPVRTTLVVRGNVVMGGIEYKTLMRNAPLPSDED